LRAAGASAVMITAAVVAYTAWESVQRPQGRPRKHADTVSQGLDDRVEQTLRHPRLRKVRGGGQQGP
jgi:hypothetical protein